MPLAAVGGRRAGPMAARPMTEDAGSPSRPIAASPAASRWPPSVSTIESDESTPTSISTNRNSIMIAPV